MRERRAEPAAHRAHLPAARHARLPRLPALAAGFALLLALVAFVPGAFAPSAAAAPSHPASAALPAHAFLLKSDPAANAVLNSPPRQVRLWYSEDINGLTSRAVVVDTTNKEVDERDSEVNRSNPKELDVDLPPLAPGTYVVAWRVQSADDGHITGGSFIFRVARPDGTVPPVPPVLPTGHVPGGGGVGTTSGQLDGPTWLLTITTFLALLLMTFWAGGLIWETWILAPVGMEAPDLAAAGQRAGERFRRMVPWALGALLVANLGMVLATSAQLTGDWSGLAALPFISAILFGSRFGAFMLVREGVVVVALVLAILELRGKPYAVSWRPAAEAPVAPAPLPEPVRLGDWGGWLLAALRASPGALVRGWRRRTLWGQVVLVLGAALVVAFGFSGHAAAVPEGELAYALSIDLLHLFGEAAWVGGLIYIAIVLVPTLRRLPERARAQMMARGLPHFSALAIITVVVLAATGSLNTAVHLTSIDQFLTTSYGRTLAIKIELFLIMAAISAYHAFWLRPRLAVSLANDTGEMEVAESDQEPWSATAGNEQTARTALHAGRAAPSVAFAGADGPRGAGGGAGARQGHDAQQMERASAASDADYQDAAAANGSGIRAATLNLASALEDWLQREAALGVAILACVALLAAFAGSLAPAPPPAAAAASTPYVSAPQTAGGLTVTLRVDPAAFGTNTFTVAVHDASGKPVDGAGVTIATQDLDMDMGIQTAQLKPTGEAGVYSGQAELTMAGNWEIIVGVLPANVQQIQKFTFKLSASY